MSDSRQPFHLIHLIGEGVFTPVLDSQILMPLRMLGDAAPHIDRCLVILTGSRHRKSGEVPPRIEAIRRTVPGVRMSFQYRLWGFVPFQRRMWAGKLKKALGQFNITDDRPIIVHCRGTPAASAALCLKARDPRIRVVVDYRGAGEDEVAFPGPVGWYFRRAHRVNREAALSGADAINTVSERMRRYLIDTSGLRDEMRHTVVGCCVDTKRFSFDPELRLARRKELGLEGKFVVCYCGAMSHWQRPDALAEAFAIIKRDMPDAHMLAISREPEPLVEHLRACGVADSDCTLASATHDKVASYLMAADVGMLLRENTITNRVASPVKFAEYLRCGLPVILTPYIGDFGPMVARGGVGKAVEFPIVSEQVTEAARALRRRLETEKDDYRRTCSRFAAEEMSWEAQLPNMIDLYESLASPDRSR